MLKKKILITGGAGFIAYNLVLALKDNYSILLIDNLLQNIDFETKTERLNKIETLENSGITFKKIDFTDYDKINNTITDYKPNIVIHLGALTGVRDSISNADNYLSININGLQNILKSCTNNNIKDIIFSSSSSVYGNMKEVDNEIAPVSFYGTTKYMGELMCENYSKLLNLNITTLRFFTIYGPSNRADMAFYKFYNAIKNDKRISLNNNGEMKRAFTFVNDVVFFINKIIEKIIEKKLTGFNCFPIGNPNSVSIKKFANTIATALEKPLNYDCPNANYEESKDTYANNKDILAFLDIDYQFKTLEEGVVETVNWFEKTYKKSTI